MSSVTLIILLGAAAKFALHLLTGAHYGFFVDELYTIALSRHLAFGYVDLPPLVPLLAAVSGRVFGDSLTAWHVLPALAGSATLVFVCLIAKEFGGKPFAIILSALGFLIVPPWLVMDSYFAYDAFDQLILAAFLYLVVRFIRSGNRKLWILLGVIAGAACLTKMTLLYFGPGFLVALLASKYRRHLLSPWPWLGAGIFLAILSPYLLWQAANHWPTVTYWIHYGTLRLYSVSIQQFTAALVTEMNPVLFPLLAFGLWRIFRRFGDTNYGFLGVMFLVTTAVLFLLRAKIWMLTALFSPLLAAGAVGIEEMVRGRSWEKTLKPAVVTAMIVGGILVAPTSLPILPIASLPAFFDRFGFLFSRTEIFSSVYTQYPLSLGLRIGWEDLVRDVAGVYDELPPEDRNGAGIFASWYGPASAIDYFGPRYGLPHAVSGHLTYYLWGPGPSWDVMIIIMPGSNTLAPFFETCEKKTSVINEFTLSNNQLNIFVCRKPLLTPEEIWPHMESYY